MNLTIEDVALLKEMKIGWPEDPADADPVTRLSRLAERTAQRAGHTASLAAKARDEPEGIVLAAADEVIRCLADDLNGATLRADDMRKTAETWCRREHEQALWARMWCGLAVIMTGAVIALVVYR